MYIEGQRVRMRRLGEGNGDIIVVVGFVGKLVG